MSKHRPDNTDPVHIGISVFANERELWDGDAMPRDQHLMLCAEAAIRIAVLAERKRCVETVNQIWDDYVEAEGHDATGKPYLRGYKDSLEDCSDTLMQIDTQEGVDAESTLMAIQDEQRMRREALAEKRDKNAEVLDLTAVEEFDDHPESPEPDTWEMMRSGNADRTKSTEEEHAPTAIEGAEQIEHIVQPERNDDLDPDQFGGSDY